MANNWKYATLSERERISEIRNGNEELYNTEKDRNKVLRNLQQQLGLSTKSVDDWDTKVDYAYNSSKKGNADRSGLPKFGASKLADINRELGNSVKRLRKERDENIAAAKSDAKSALEYLEEWLANNGYSSDGSFAGKSRKNLESALESLLESIKDDYDEQLISTRSKFLSMVK